MRHVGEIKAVSVSPDGALCVTGAIDREGGDRHALIWDVRSLDVVGELRGHHPNGVCSTAWSPTGQVIATAGGGGDSLVRLWDAKSLKPIGELGRDLFLVHALAFSPDGQFLLTGSANHAPAASVHDGSCFRVWDVRRRKEVARLGTHAFSIHAVAFSCDGQFAACGGVGTPVASRPAKAGDTFCPQTIRVWKIKKTLLGVKATEKFAEAMEHTKWVNSVQFTPDGGRLFTAGRGNFLWELPSCRAVRRFQPDAFDFANCGAVSPDGRYAATGTGGQDEVGAAYKDCFVRLWDMSTSLEIARWPHQYPVQALAFSPDGTLVIAGGQHGELHTWEIAQLDGIAWRRPSSETRVACSRLAFCPSAGPSRESLQQGKHLPKFPV